jgi:hypothetical protein
MAAAPKLTPDQWAAFRKIWQEDERQGFTWLVREYDMPVSEAAVRKKAKSDGWLKVKAMQDAEAEKAKETRRKRQRKSAPDQLCQGSKPSSKDQKVTNHANHDSANHANHGKSVEGEFISGFGRPPLYREEYASIAFKLCLAGFQNIDVAEALMIAESTFYEWMSKYPDFSESVARGRAVADSEVAHSLFQAAVGYEHDAVHIAVYLGEVIVEGFKKRYPPDVSAAKFWLTNRQPHRWKNKVEVETEVDLSLVPTQESLRELYEASLQRSEEKAAKVLGDRMGRLGLTLNEYNED